MELKQALSVVKHAFEKKHKAAVRAFDRRRAKREKVKATASASTVALLYMKAAGLERDAAREEMNGLPHLLHCLSEFERQQVIQPVRTSSEPSAPQKSARPGLRLVG